MEVFSQLVKDLGPTKLGLISVVALALIIGFVILSMKLSSSPLSVLYSNLDLKESADIVTELDTQGVEYEVRLNGTQILVPEDKITGIRINMAKKGLPSSGSIVGYEIFDHSEALGTSSFVQNVNLLRALEGELSRTISSFSQVNSARVHLVMPKRELFSRDKQKPSASVVLSLRRSEGLSKDEINAIAHLVVSAVPGLELSKVTIVDSKGRPFKLSSGDPNSESAFATSSDDMRVAYENRLRASLEDMLEQSLGIGKVKVKVSADMNFDRIVTNSEIYDPDSQVVRSVQSISERESSSEGGPDNVSVTTNLPDEGSENANGGSRNFSERSDETTNYEISKTIRNHISETGTLNKLSVAVLVDGIYNTDDETDEISYLPRSEEELAKIASFVRTAVGYNEGRGDKVEVINMQFITDLTQLKDETFVDFLKRELINIIQTLVVGVVVILVILLVVRPIAIRAFEITKDEIEELEVESTMATVEKEQTHFEEEPAIDIAKIETRTKVAAIKSINEIVDRYPEECLSIMRSWMNKEM